MRPVKHLEQYLYTKKKNRMSLLPELVSICLAYGLTCSGCYRTCQLNKVFICQEHVDEIWCSDCVQTEYYCNTCSQILHWTSPELCPLCEHDGTSTRCDCCRGMMCDECSGWLCDDCMDAIHGYDDYYR
uniref:Uncharacterized protein n=1 Tax=viral metagenome TaxID=1070528 RepID=A0A6C0BPH1_9ZZZZ